MGKLPTDVSGREVCRALEQVGFLLRRQRGSHMVLRRNDPFARVVVPDHRTVRVGTLRHIVNQSGLTVDEFLRLLGRE